MHDIPGAVLPAPPKPLLPNWGRARAEGQIFDAMESSPNVEMDVCTDGWWTLRR